MLQIKALRERHQPPFTQEALAYRAGVSVKTVARAERLGRASGKTLERLAAALGTSIRDLFEEAA